ncbi:hypothetical protein [Krasilnikovia sp. M28-CT-15]|uniref:hypothetical protein n=1 Tax=Krasilnikovia sp. M28-CT-15 TaxID=3373540 RepID=UPI0038764F7C
MPVLQHWLGAARSALGAAAAVVAVTAAAALGGATPAAAAPSTTVWTVADGSPVEVTGRDVDIKFQATAGDHVIIECLGKPRQSSPFMSLYAPGGDSLRTKYVCPSEPNVWGVVAEAAALPETGVYTFNARVYSSLTETFRVTTITDTVVSLPDDSEQRAHPALPRGNVLALFDGVAGEHVHIGCFTYAIESRSYGSVSQVELILLGPDNKVIPATDQDARRCYGVDLRRPRIDGTAADLDLPATGEYRLVLDYSRATIPTRDTLLTLHRTPAAVTGTPALGG